MRNHPCLRVLFVLAAGLLAAACSSSHGTPSKDGGGPGDADTDAEVAAPGGDDASPTGNPCGDAGAVAMATEITAGDQIPSMAVGPNAFYWSQFCSSCPHSTGQLWMQSLAGGSPTQVALPMTTGGSDATPDALAVDGSLLWFTDGDGLEHLDLDGSNPQLVARAADLPIVLPPWAIAFDDANVYLLSSDTSFDTTIVSVPKSGGSVRTVTTLATANTATREGLVVDARNVYWYDGLAPGEANGAGLYTAPKTGGTASLLVSLLGVAPTAVAAGPGDTVYVGPAFLADSTTPSLLGVHTSTPKAAPVVVATSVGAPIAVVASSVYFRGTVGTTPTIMQACKGGPGVPVAALPTGAIPSVLVPSGAQLFAAGLLAQEQSAPPGGAIWSMPQ